MTAERSPAGASANSWERRPAATFCLTFSCLALPVLAVFGRALFHDQQFAFQDAGHYYYPLLQRVQQEWDAGRWPLWCPEASAGTPLLGNPTAAVLYPGKLVFFLLPHAWAVRVFVMGHVALAFGAVWAMLRTWRVSLTGSTLGALAYSFGVPVLCQTSNVIFLVGASWSPLGFLAADLWVRERRRLALPALASVLCLQVLGGDPEAAYVTFASALGYAACLAAVRSTVDVGRLLCVSAAALAAVYLGLLGLSFWSARAIRSAVETPSTWLPPKNALVVAAWAVGASFLVRRVRASNAGQVRLFADSALGLLVAAALGLALAGAQLVPVVEYTSLSFRAAESEGFHDVYPYSAHPLQLLDAVWPNVFGTLEGGYRSWLNALPPKPGSRLWMPSVYLGGLTLVLASASAGFRDGPPWRGWLTVVAVVSLLASLGYYGSPLLWARCVPGAADWLGPIEPPFSWQVRTDGALRDGDGGVFWFLGSAFPGFRSFRYPPKLLVFWSLAVSGLAGDGWDRLVLGHSRRARLAASSVLVSSLLALTLIFLFAGPLRSWFDALGATLRTSDEPLDVPRALFEIRTAVARGAVVAALALGLITLAGRRPLLAGPLAVAVLAVDLVEANAYHVVTVPQSFFEGTSRALEVIREAERLDPSPGPYRVQRVGRWWPARWSEGGAPRRFDEVTRWERNSLRPNYNLPLGVESTFYFDTLEPIDYGLFFLPWALVPDPESARTHGLKPGQNVWYHPRRGFDLWNTRYFIVPGRLVWESPERGYASVIPRSTYLYPAPGAFDGPDGPALRARWGATDDFRVLRNDAAYPRAWVVHKAYVVPPVRSLRVTERSRIMRALLYQNDEFWRVPGVPVRDLRSVAWVETDRPSDVDRFLSRADPDASETVSVTLDAPQRVELTAVLRSPGLVVVADAFYPGWAVTVDGLPAEIFRTNRAMRGVPLPAGTHRLVFRYDPLSFRLGAALSALGLAALSALIVWGFQLRPNAPRWAPARSGAANGPGPSGGSVGP